MKNTAFIRGCRLALLILLASAFPLLAAAQGPAGAGASEAAGGKSSSRSYNPAKWFGKKDATKTDNIPVDLDKRLEPRLRAAHVLGDDASLKDVCGNFLERVDCVSALYASQKLGIRFDCVRSSMTGVRTDVNAISCQMPETDKPLSLTKTIRLLKPDADAKNAAKEAEAAAREDVKQAAS